MPRHFTADELDTLRRLRSIFLSYETGAAGGGGYWESEAELELYDSTFARRIAWKWDAVLAELAARGRLPRARTVLDWGCGSGVAARAYLAVRPDVERVLLVDHSPLAVRFAERALRAAHPGVEVRAARAPLEPPDLLLVSHVLDELDPEPLAELCALAERSAAVVWVEPGTKLTSHALGEVRARLAATLDVLAPCTHQAACGALASSGSWCHSFARPPEEVFTEGRWAELGRELGIDLRSLPYSFLAVARRGTFELAGPAARLVGRPRLTRGRAELELCDERGLHALDYLQRTDKALFKALDDVAGDPWLVDAVHDGRRISAMKRRDR
jgi:SAM-dependent methyltransferase